MLGVIFLEATKYFVHCAREALKALDLTTVGHVANQMG